MAERKIRKRTRKTLSGDEKAAFERAAAQAESAEVKQEVRRSFAEHARLRELVVLLKAERKRQRLSLSQVAERVEMDPANLHRLENNPNANPTLETIQRLAHALGKQIRVELVDEAA